MAPRWIGLARPHLKESTRQTRIGERRKLKISREHHPLDGTLRGVGAACVLGAGLLFNWALFPEAAGQTLSMWGQPFALIAPQANTQLAALPDTTPVVVNEAEAHLLAATAWGEARSEGADGMRAVAHVMVNRVGQRFGGDLETVILAPKQFSVWNVGDPNRPLVRNPERYARSGENRETWVAAQQIAREVLSGQSVDPTNGALFYHTRAIRPWWSRFGEGRQEIGAHVFYRDVPDRYGAERPRVTRTAAHAPADAAIDAPGQPQRGARAGRVNGVIQYAPAQQAATPAQSAPMQTAANDPALAAAMAQLPTSGSY